MNLDNLDYINITITKSPYLIYYDTIVGKSIYSKHEIVGKITYMDDNYVYGIVDKDKWQFVDNRICSLEFVYKV